jgi:hypothetical protein
MTRVAFAVLTFGLTFAVAPTAFFAPHSSAADAARPFQAGDYIGGGGTAPAARPFQKGDYEKGGGFGTGLGYDYPAIAVVAAQSVPSEAEEYSLFSPRLSSTGGFSEMFGSWNVLKDRNFDPRNLGFVAFEDDDFGGGIFIRCITDRPDFLVVVDRKKAVLNGDQANIRIRADGRAERQFYGGVYGDRFVQLDDPLSAIAVLVNAQVFAVGVDISGVQSVLNFVVTSRHVKALASVMSQCQVPVTAKGK